MEQGSFYLTTPIYYVNSVPHLGTAYTTIAADALARYRRMTGSDVFFLTGLDEHGQKVAQAAEDNGMTPQEWCDAIAPKFRETWELLGVSNDDFIRTTEERHKARRTGVLDEASRRRLPVQGQLRRLVLRAVRDLLHRRPARRRQVSELRA